jgi:uncharacterized PurR-regulated membrane protein YhhQ (DUF165 family)
MSSTKKRIIASGVIGNFLENFDFMLCAFLAQFIAITFFPSGSMANRACLQFALTTYVPRLVRGI